jgi:hypothetical protein
VDEVGDHHPVLVGILAGMENMTIEIDGLFAVGEDGRDPDLIVSLHVEIFKCLVNRFGVVAFGELQAQHGAGGLEVELSGDDAALAAALTAIEGSGAKIERKGARSANLETVFLTLTGRSLRDT